MPQTPISQARSARTLITFAVIAAALALPASASAISGGSQVIVIPKIVKVACATNCVGKKTNRKARGGSLIRIKGDDLDSAQKVVFLGSAGKADDTVASLASAKMTTATVRVPPDSSTGPIIAVTASGTKSKASTIIPILPQPPVIGTPDLKPVDTGIPNVTLEAGTSTPRTVFLGSKELVRYSLKVSGADNVNAQVTLKRISTGETVGSWSIPAPSGQVVSVDWNGDVAGVPGSNGRYAFSTTLSSGTAAFAAAAAAPPVVEARDAFDLYGFIFPLRGKHVLSAGIGRFGAARSGHIHQGQDIMAKCGTKMVAARGGTVMQSSFQSAAGNYIVIRPDAPGVGDEAYMHMPVKSVFKKGDHVYTGQQIGVVGETGDATACHLHFEQWSGAIWQSKPVDPFSSLKAWDLVS
jgi:murein DD-endopeptidase MepM/ murein hydrolase activator NlpD